MLCVTQLHREQPSVDYLSLTRCLEALGNAADTAALLVAMSRSSDEAQQLMALQIAFDIAENDDQQFLAAVSSALPDRRTASLTAAASSSSAESAGADGDESGSWARLDRLREVLRGETTLKLQVHFLFCECRADTATLRRMKDSQLQMRHNPILHHALVVSHAFMVRWLYAIPFACILVQ